MKSRVGGLAAALAVVLCLSAVCAPGAAPPASPRPNILLILTEVDKVCLDFKKPTQRVLSSMTVAEAISYMEEGHFAPGSMLPKVMAAIKFARTFPGRKAIITSLSKAVEALDGLEGTVVTMA